MIVTVAACVECPMFAEVNASCTHPSGEPLTRMYDTARSGVPGWCPLRDEPMHVYLAPQKLKPIEGAP